MNIGQPEKTITVVPIEQPVKEGERIPSEPQKVPSKEPQKKEKV